MTKHVLTQEEHFCLEGCRSYDQYVHMRTQFEKETCPFCDIDPNINNILWEDQYACAWSVSDQFLRTGLKYHLIVAPKKHLRYPWDLSMNELVSMHVAQVTLAERFTLYGGVIATRFGDMRLNAGTVPHLHTNIMEPNGTGEIRIPVYKDPKDRKKNRDRAAEFAKRYEAGEDH